MSLFSNDFVRCGGWTPPTSCASFPCHQAGLKCPACFVLSAHWVLQRMHQGCKPPTPADVVLNSLSRRSSPGFPCGRPAWGGRHRKERTRPERWEIKLPRTGDPTNESHTWSKRDHWISTSLRTDYLLGSAFNSRDTPLAVSITDRWIKAEFGWNYG